MKYFRIVGTFIFDYVIITVLLSLSLVTVIFFVPMFIGVVNYFKKHYDDRRIRDIFSYLKEDWAIVIKFTLLEIFVLIIPILNIVYFNTGDRSNAIITTISFVVLIYGVLMLVNAPVLILNMKLKLFQLMFNSLTLIYGKWWLSLITIAGVFGVVVACTYFPYITPFVLYFLALIIQKSTIVNFNKLKAAQEEKNNTKKIKKKKKKTTTLLKIRRPYEN